MLRAAPTKLPTLGLRSHLHSLHGMAAMPVTMADQEVELMLDTMVDQEEIIGAAMAGDLPTTVLAAEVSILVGIAMPIKMVEGNQETPPRVTSYVWGITLSCWRSHSKIGNARPA